MMRVFGKCNISSEVFLLKSIFICCISSNVVQDIIINNNRMCENSVIYSRYVITISIRKGLNGITCGINLQA